MAPTNQCPMPLPNYYNPYNYSGNFVSGTVVEDGNPSHNIENAVVYGWNAIYRCPTQTFTDANGNFVLTANNKDSYFPNPLDPDPLNPTWFPYDCNATTNGNPDNIPNPDNLQNGTLGIIRVSAFAASVINDDLTNATTPHCTTGVYCISISTELTKVVQNVTITSGQTENYTARKSIEMSNIIVHPGGSMSAVAGREIHVGQTTHFSYGSNVRLSIGNVPPDCRDPAITADWAWKRLGNSSGNTKPKEKDTVIILYPETNVATAVKKTENMIADVEVIPNPAHEKFFVVLPQTKENEHFEISLLNPLGKTIYRQEFYTRKVLSFETNSYPNGIYFVLIKTEDGYISIKKIAIQK